MNSTSENVEVILNIYLLNQVKDAEISVSSDPAASSPLAVADVEVDGQLSKKKKKRGLFARFVMAKGNSLSS